MIIYKDILTGDELFTDSFKMKHIGPNKSIIQITSKKVPKGGDALDDSLFGANPSAEEEAEEMDSSVEMVIDVVEYHSLQNVTSIFPKGKEGKTLFQSLLKAYLKKLTAKKEKEAEKLREAGKNDLADALKEEMAKMKTDLNADMKEVILSKKMKELDIYVGATAEPVADSESLGMIIPAYFEEEAVTPSFYFIKYGLEEEKQ